MDPYRRMERPTSEEGDWKWVQQVMYPDVVVGGMDITLINLYIAAESTFNNSWTPYMSASAGL